MKTIYKIIAGTSIVAIPAATTIGIVYGTKEAKGNYFATKAETYGQKYFDEHMKEAGSSYAPAHLLNPSGGYNLSSLVRLDENMDSSHAHNFIALGPDGKESPSLIRATVNVNSAMRRDQLEAAFLEANQKIGKYLERVNEEDKKSLGIYIGKDSVRREITAAVYKVKSISDEDKALMNHFWNDFGPIAQGNFGPNKPDAFLQIFGAQCALAQRQQNYFQFSFHDTTNGLPGTSITETKLGELWEYDTISPTKWKEDHPNSFQLYDGAPDSKSQHIILKKLAKKDLFATYEPIVDFKNHQLKVILRGWKLNGSSQIRFLDGDQVYNPIGVYTKELVYDLNDLGNETDIKTPENRLALKSFLSDTIIKYVNYKTIRPGLEILGAAIPSLRSFAEEFMRVSDLLGQYNKKYTDIFTDDFLDKLLDKLSHNKTVNGTAFIDVIKNFENHAFNPDDSLNYWTNIKQLSSLYAYAGGQFRMYQLVSAMKVITGDIEKEVFTVHKEAQYIQDDSLIQKLLGFLKMNNVVDADFTVNRIIANPEQELVNILFRLADNHVNISEEAAREILPIIPINMISGNVDGWAKAFNILTTGNNLSNILKFFGNDKDQVKENIAKLISGGSDALWKTIGDLLKKRAPGEPQVTKEMVMSLFKVVKATGILPSFLDKLMGDTDKAAGTWVNLFNSGGVQHIFQLVQKAFDEGLDAMINSVAPLNVSYDPSAFENPQEQKLNDQHISRLNTLIDDIVSHKAEAAYQPIYDELIQASELNGTVTADQLKQWANNTRDEVAEYLLSDSADPIFTNAVNPLSEQDRTNLVNYYKAASPEIQGRFKQAASAAMMPHSTDEEVIKFIKPDAGTPITTKRFSVFNLPQIVVDNDLAKAMKDPINDIVGAIDFANLGLSETVSGVIGYFKPLIAKLIPRIITDLWQKPLNEAVDPVLDAYGPILAMVPGIDKYIDVVRLVSRMATHGLANPFDSNVVDSAGNHISPAQHITNILSAFFPSGFVKGDATTAPSATITTKALAPLINGLLSGFNTEDEAANAFTAVLGSNSFLSPSIIRDVYTRGSIADPLLGSILHNDLQFALHELIKKGGGLQHFSKETFHKLFNGLHETLNKPILNDADILGDPLVSGMIGSIKPLLDRLKDFITKDRIDALSESFYAVLHQPLKDATADDYNLIIDLINKTELLKSFKLEHFGSAIQHLVTGGLGSVTPAEWGSVLRSINQGSLVETIQKLAYGTHYKAKVVASLKAQVDALHAPAKVALASGVTLDAALPTFDELNAIATSKLTEANYAITHSDKVPLADINTKVLAYISAIDALVERNRLVTALNTQAAAATPTGSASHP